MTVVIRQIFWFDHEFLITNQIRYQWPYESYISHVLGIFLTWMNWSVESILLSGNHKNLWISKTSKIPKFLLNKIGGCTFFCHCWTTLHVIRYTRIVIWKSFLPLDIFFFWKLYMEKCCIYIINFRCSHHPAGASP